MSVTAFLDRLERVKETGTNRGLASCPGPLHARGDRHRSLSWRVADDRLLIHCFVGCEPAQILSAVNLRLSDLYDHPNKHQAGRMHLRIPASDMLEAISLEVTVVSLIAADMILKRTVATDDFERLCTAAKRINAARDLMHVS